jgi:hypothetical protein
VTPPENACGEYRDYRGDTTWVKDLDLTNPHRPLAYVWSRSSKRWRTRREMIRMERLRLFVAPRETEQ